MNAVFESAWNLASQLTASDRNLLAERLSASVPDDVADSENFGLDEATWQELERRLSSIDHGTALLVPGEEGLLRVRQTLMDRRSA